MKILFRTCENLDPTSGTRPEWCMEKDFKLKCFKSLVDSIDEGTEVFIIGDKLTEETISKYKDLYPALTISNSTKSLGNQQSLCKMFEFADSFSNDDDIVYFCEDDYLHSEDFYKCTVNFFNSIGNKFEDVFFHPADYPDQYTDSRMRRNYIFKNESLPGWYREVDSTTFTFACKVKTYRKFSALLKDCSIQKKIGYDQQMKPIFHPSGADDGRFSEIFGHKNFRGYTTFHQTALCFCPLPGVASHMHKGTESLFFDWKELYGTIKLKFDDN